MRNEISFHHQTKDAKHYYLTSQWSESRYGTFGKRQMVLWEILRNNNFFSYIFIWFVSVFVVLFIFICLFLLAFIVKFIASFIYSFFFVAVASSSQISFIMKCMRLELIRLGIILKFRKRLLTLITGGLLYHIYV